MPRDIQPRKPPADDDFSAADDIEETSKPVKRKKGRLILPGHDLVDMDGRKLSKKQEIDLAAWKGKNRGKQMDLLFRGAAERAKLEFGHRAVYVGSEVDRLVVCIPIPSLAFEFVIAQDGFPLGVVYQLVALTGVGKSGLVAEIGRWFDMAFGGEVINENETKINGRWFKSIMGNELYERTMVNRCDSVEDWQEKLTFSVKDMKNFMIGTKEKPGPGPMFPMCYVVDTVMGKQSRETIEKIFGAVGKKGKRGKTGTGSAGKGFPAEALSISKYMRSFAAELDNWPFALVLVNQLRINTNDRGYEERHKAGGKQIDFQESFELELTKLGGPKKMIECADWSGYPIAISCHKNSFGPGHRRIVTRLLWWEEEDDEGNWEQKTIWDWDWSTIWLLHNMLGPEGSIRIRNNLKALDFHLDCPETGEVDNLAWSKTLGMKKTDAVSWAELGAMIRRDKPLMAKLRTALRINSRARLKGNYIAELNSEAKNLP